MNLYAMHSGVRQRYHGWKCDDCTAILEVVPQNGVSRVRFPGVYACHIWDGSVSGEGDAEPFSYQCYRHSVTLLRIFREAEHEEEGKRAYDWPPYVKPNDGHRDGTCPPENGIDRIHTSEVPMQGGKATYRCKVFEWRLVTKKWGLGCHCSCKMNMKGFDAKLQQK